MTKKEIFAKVQKHLLKQRAKSFASNRYAYRGDNGTMCAIGCLIKDEAYSGELEGSGIYSTRVQRALDASSIRVGRSLTSPTFQMLAALQRLHDLSPVNDWAKGLRAIELKYVR